MEKGTTNDHRNKMIKIFHFWSTHSVWVQTHIRLDLIQDGALRNCKFPLQERCNFSFQQDFKLLSFFFLFSYAFGCFMLIPVNYLLMERKGVIRVINHKEATSADILRSFFHALILANLTGKAKSLHTESRLWMEEHYHDFIAKVQLKTKSLSTAQLIINWNTRRNYSLSLFSKCS